MIELIILTVANRIKKKMKRKDIILVQKKNQFKAKMSKKVVGGRERVRAKKRQTKTGKKFFDTHAHTHTQSLSPVSLLVDELKNSDRIE